jgi:hypothetical protein
VLPGHEHPHRRTHANTHRPGTRAHGLRVNWKRFVLAKFFFAFLAAVLRELAVSSAGILPACSPRQNGGREVRVQPARRRRYLPEPLAETLGNLIVMTGFDPALRATRFPPIPSSRIVPVRSSRAKLGSSFPPGIGQVWLCGPMPKAYDTSTLRWTLHSSRAPPVPLLTSNQLPPCKTPASSSPLTALPKF